MVAGGRAFVLPWIQKVQRISLNSMTLVIESPRVYSKQGVPVSVTGIAQVKIQGKNSEMLRAACEQFLGKTEDEIREVAKETLDGHQRAIIASMTVEEIYKQRKTFSKKVFEIASSDLVDMGFTIVSYTIKDISDEEGYLKALGICRTSEVKRDARIAEAEAKRDSVMKEAEAEELHKKSKFENEAEIARAKMEFEKKKALYDKQVFEERAKSDKAAELQAAKCKREIMREEMQIKFIEREQQILVQKQETKRMEYELEAMVKKPAEAELEKMKLLAQAHAERIRLEAEAEAKVLKMLGEAEAYAIQVKAKAEADAMAKKANAFKDYEDAAKIEMVLETLPKVRYSNWVTLLTTITA
jgi:flotillin